MRTLSSGGVVAILVAGATLLVVNALVGFWEESQAGNAIAAVKAKLALSARERRGGQRMRLPARELVLGDLNDRLKLLAYRIFDWKQSGLLAHVSHAR